MSTFESRVKEMLKNPPDKITIPREYGKHGDWFQSDMMACVRAVCFRVDKKKNIEQVKKGKK